MTLLKITEGMTVFFFFFNALLKYQLCQKYFTDIQKICFKHSKKFISGMLK